MKFLSPFLLALAFVPPSFADEKKADPAPIPAVIVPDSPATPTPKPDPATPVGLAVNQSYVIRSANPITIRQSTKGLITVTADTGPLRVKGLLIAGPGGTEAASDGTKVVTRNFTEKYIYTIESAGTGQVTLLIVLDAADESKDITRVLNVGGGPSPPTPIPPGPGPGPPIPVDPFAAALQASYAADSDTDKAASAASLAKLYRAAALLSGSKNLSTVGGVMAWIKGSEDIAATAIPGTRKTIGAELNKVLPADKAATLDDATRALLAKHFTRVAVALEGLVK